MRFPSQKPTPSEYAVLVLFTSAVFVVMGVVALAAAFRAAPEKQELAAVVMKGGFLSLSIGIAIAAGFWLFRRLTH